MGHVDLENPWDSEHAKGTIGKSVSGDPEVYLFYAKSKNISSTSAASCVLSVGSHSPQWRVAAALLRSRRRRPIATGTSRACRSPVRPLATSKAAARPQPPSSSLSHQHHRRGAVQQLFFQLAETGLRMLLAAGFAPAGLAVLAARSLPPTFPC